MNVQDFRSIVASTAVMLPVAVTDVLTNRAEVLTDDERQTVADMLLESLRVHGELLANGVHELTTLLRKSKADERKAVESADASPLPEF